MPVSSRIGLGPSGTNTVVAIYEATKYGGGLFVALNWVAHMYSGLIQVILSWLRHVLLVTKETFSKRFPVTVIFTFIDIHVEHKKYMDEN